jgi:hypothetical protein
MGKVNALLNERLKKSPSSSKMEALAQQSAKGNLSTFSGIFSVEELTSQEKLTIEAILNTYASAEGDITQDLEQLISITSEVKAINHQAALLHGERIKRAHSIFTHYRDGAFTAWLTAAYGNRQTPYNLMQYYEFYEQLPTHLRAQIELMPRQAVYTLATRKGPVEKKQHIVQNYRGQSKAELLNLIRSLFPLEMHDKRRGSSVNSLLDLLKKIQIDLRTQLPGLNSKEVSLIQQHVAKIHALLKKQ